MYGSQCVDQRKENQHFTHGHGDPVMREKVSTSTVSQPVFV